MSDLFFFKLIYLECQLFQPRSVVVAAGCRLLHSHCLPGIRTKQQIVVTRLVVFNQSTAI